MLTVLGGMNAVLFASVLIALLVRLHPPRLFVKTEWRNEWWPYVMAMFAVTLAILISQTYHQNFSAPHYDGPARFWLAIPVFLLFYRFNLRVFDTLQYAFPIAAITGWFLAKDIGTGATLPLIDKIRYGDSMLMFSMLSLLSIDWLGRDVLYLRMLKWAGFLFGLVATLQSGTRGALLAIPVFVAIYLISRGIRLSLKSILGSFTLGILVIAGAYLSNSTIQNRVQEMVTEVTTFNQGNRDTSTGIRWQLYVAAVEIISEHPIFGVGTGGYALQMAAMATEGKITPIAAEYGRGEVHNDLLKKTADMGVFGLAALMAVYLVPLWMFRKASSSDSKQIQRAGVMGMLFVSGFMVFGLTAEVLNLTMTISFYSFTIAALLAYCHNIHHAKQDAF
jgi:O-antigen ligase